MTEEKGTVGRWIGKERERERERIRQGKQLIHHKLRNKEKRGCVEAAPENPQTPASSRRNFTYLLSLAGRNCLRYWHRTVPHTYDLLDSRPPPLTSTSFILPCAFQSKQCSGCESTSSYPKPQIIKSQVICVEIYSIAQTNFLPQRYLCA